MLRTKLLKETQKKRRSLLDAEIDGIDEVELKVFHKKARHNDQALVRNHLKRTRPVVKKTPDKGEYTDRRCFVLPDVKLSIAQKSYVAKEWGMQLAEHPRGPRSAIADLVDDSGAHDECQRGLRII